ncbi:hypothetical protein [Pseudomonas asiatica]|uniref:hypothetical protein n=1 Tax=Pseudomonas asiatica TaxID=2219225 RepID=UPI003BA352BD|nr:hypothetical protein [Pseudomonas shirazica]
MRVFALFYLLAFTVFFGIGYWNSSHNPPPSVEVQIMQHLEVYTADKPTALQYRVDDSRFVQYSPVTQRLSSSYPLVPGAGFDVGIDPALVMISGASIGLNIDTLAKNKTLIRVLNRVTGKSKRQRVFGTILGAISGYSLGSYFGGQIAIDPASDEIQKLLRKKETWGSIEAQYSNYRLDKLSESLDDLPQYIYDRYSYKLSEARRAILQLRGRDRESFTNEMSLILALEKEIAPHFNLLEGAVENSWGQFIDELKLYLGVLKWGCLVVIVSAIIMWVFESYKVLRTKISTKRNKRQ